MEWLQREEDGYFNVFLPPVQFITTSSHFGHDTDFTRSYERIYHCTNKYVHPRVLIRKTTDKSSCDETYTKTNRDMDSIVAVYER